MNGFELTMSPDTDIEEVQENMVFNGGLFHMKTIRKMDVQWKWLWWSCLLIVQSINWLWFSMVGIFLISLDPLSSISRKEF